MVSEVLVFIEWIGIIFVMMVLMFGRLVLRVESGRICLELIFLNEWINRLKIIVFVLSGKILMLMKLSKFCVNFVVILM